MSETNSDVAALTDPRLTRARNTALAVLDAGWQLRKLYYCPAAEVAALDVYTPAHRGLTVTSSQAVVPHCQCSTSGLVIQLAQQVADLGHTGGGDLIGDLTWTLCEHTRRYPPGPRRDPIPDPELGRQPLNLRTTYWLLATLVGGYHWEIQQLGEDIAGGGFLADIPGDVLAIYPAAMPADGTPATNLARMLAHLEPAGLDYLRTRTAAELSHAYHGLSA
jgi:hypothetical protein